MTNHRAAWVVGLAVILVVLAVLWTRSRHQTPAVMMMQRADRSVAIMATRALARREVIRRLQEGELSLVQAAAMFRDINNSPAWHPCDIRRIFPGNSGEEKLCRQVIVCARSQTQNEQFVAELERELVRLLAAGEIVLPAPTGGRAFDVSLPVEGERPQPGD